MSGMYFDVEMLKLKGEQSNLGFNWKTNITDRKRIIGYIQVKLYSLETTLIKFQYSVIHVNL